MGALAGTLNGTLAKGSPEYQSKVVGNAAATMRPNYLRAFNDARQSAANRGLTSSPAGAALTQAPREQFNTALAGVSGQAAVDAANLAEENRVRQERRNWDLEDRDNQRKWQEKLLDRQDEKDNGGIWDSLVGGVGSGLGSFLGGPLGMAGGKLLSSWFNKPSQANDTSEVDALMKYYGDKMGPAY